MAQRVLDTSDTESVTNASARPSQAWTALRARFSTARRICCGSAFTWTTVASGKHRLYGHFFTDRLDAVADFAKQRRSGRRFAAPATVVVHTAKSRRRHAAGAIVRARSCRRSFALAGDRAERAHLGLVLPAKPGKQLHPTERIAHFVSDPGQHHLHPFIARQSASRIVSSVCESTATSSSPRKARSAPGDRGHRGPPPAHLRSDGPKAG